MRALFVHADRFEYAALERTRVAEDVPEERKRGAWEDCLVCFLTME